jgi:pimeloyl-ACP methyl ester carboxylesterase
VTTGRVPLPVRRLGHAALGRIAPGLAGRIATDAFTSSRTLGTRPDDVPPLGARRFEVRDAPDIRGGYLWGDEGPIALLVHGWGADSSGMHGLVAPLRALGYRVAAFDAPGHGVSDGTRTTMPEFTRATRDVLDALGDVRMIVAHSLGSIAAVGAVAQCPAPPVECLVLIAPTCTLTGVLQRWARSELRLRRRIVAWIDRELHRRTGVPISHWDVVGLGADLDCRVLVIHDPQDAVVPYSEAEAITAGLRHARLEATPGHGHFGVLMAPAVKERITAFAAAHATSGPTAA